MGIPGLLPLLKRASTPCNIRRFSGMTVGVDAYCWLHKGAFGCAVALGKGEETTAYINYCLKLINLLRSAGVKVVMVLDGRDLPSKKGTEEKRRSKREENRKLARNYLKKGMNKEAWECFTKAVDVTPAMAREFVKVLRSQSIDYVIAPYEADAQLAYLSNQNLIDIVITEDSDLVAFGCKKIFFKMSSTGDGTLLELERIPKALKWVGEFDFIRFRWMCILSGCDYLGSLPGIGLGRGRRVVENFGKGGVEELLRSIPSILNMDIDVPQEYIDGFIRAERTFLHQLVFDTRERRVRRLTPVSVGLLDDDLGYAGGYLDEDLSLGLALGNVDLETLEVVDVYRVESFKPGSIWCNGGEIDEKVDIKKTAMEFSVKKGVNKKKRKLDREAIDVDDDVDLMGIYGSRDEDKLSPASSSSFEEEEVDENRSIKKSSNPFLKKTMVCLIERNKVYHDNINEEEIIVKSRYFRKEESESNDEIDSQITIYSGQEKDFINKSPELITLEEEEDSSPIRQRQLRSSFGPCKSIGLSRSSLSQNGKGKKKDFGTKRQRTLVEMFKGGK